MAGPDLWAARQQMALSLGWHIVVACFRVGFPALVVAGARSTLVAMSVSLGVGAVLFVPPLVALLVLHARGELDPEPDVE